MKLKGLNASPVQCFRWLRVNDKDMEINMVPNTPYTNTICTWTENEAYCLQPSVPNGEPWAQGLSEEFATLVMEQQNSGFALEVMGEVKNPIHIRFDLDAQNPSLWDRNTIVCRENTSATVVIQYRQEKNIQPLHMGQLKIQCERNSQLKIIYVSSIHHHFQSVYITEEADADVEWIAVDFAKSQNMIRYQCDLNGERSINNVHTVYYGADKDVLDFNYILHHNGRGSRGTIETKGVLDDQANKTMRDTIAFARGAKKAVGKESEYVMMLSDKVVNNSIPLLLCDEDDVAGEHAASIGRIGEELLFYLMSRGLDQEQAKKIMMLGYFQPMIDRIEDPAVQEIVRHEIEERVGADVERTVSHI